MRLVRLVKIIIAVSVLQGTVGAYAKPKKDAGLSGLKYKAGDETGNDAKAVKAELLIAAQEERAMAQLQGLLKKYKGTSLEADLLMRKAELHMRRAKTDRFMELHRDSTEALLVAPKLIKAAASKQHVTKAIAVFDDIEKRFPRFEKLDSVIFNNAFANQQIGDIAKAEKKFQRLVREFSGSPLLPDAHLALGELAFRSRDFKKALAHFSAIRQFPDSLVYPYGIYKAGWTLYNLRDAEGGLKELEDVIRYGRFVREQGIDARLDLRKEALIDMALFYEDVRPAKEAFQYFEKQAADLDASPVILRLSGLYKRHGRHADTKTILTEMIKRSPTSNYVPMAYVELMEASEKLKKTRDVVTLLGNFSQVCEADSAWARAQTLEALMSKESPLVSLLEKSDKKITTPAVFCHEVFKRMALGYANKWLRIWQKDSQQNEWAESAESAFAVYLKKDARDDESARARFVYAELQFKRAKYREASENYALAAQFTKDVKIAHDSRYYALIALEKAVQDKWSDKDEARFRYLAGEYLNKSQDAKYRLDIDFKLAHISYEKGRYDEAAPTFLRLGQAYAKEDKGMKSQDLYLDILNIKKDYVGLRDYSLQLRAKATGERVEKLTKIYEEAYFVIIQRLEDRRETEEAIRQYEAFAVKNPQSKLTQKALWNTAQLHFKANDPMSGAKSLVAYFEKYPSSKEGLQALIKAAQTFESLGQLQPAAEVLERLAALDKENKTKWNLMAADFYLLSFQMKRARPLYESLPRGTEAGFRALNQLEWMARVEGRTAGRVALLKELVSVGRQPEASLAAVHFVEEAYAQNKHEEAFQLAKKVLAQEKSGAAKSALARARLVQARVLEKEFRSQSVKSRLDRIETVLTLKTEKLSRAQLAFQSAANYGDPVISVKAYRELADCYLHYSESLQNMPVPDGVPKDEVEAFRAEMEKLAIPMEEKGIETKVLAYRAARELGVEPAIVSEIQAEMKKLNQPTAKDNATVKLMPAALVTPRVEGGV